MSFASELSTLMNGNAGINSSVQGVFRDTTSTEFDATKYWVIYTYTRNPNISVFGDREAIAMYTLYVEVYTDGASKTESISDTLRTYITDYSSSNILEIDYQSETHSNAADANNAVAFVNLMQFEVMYKK